MNKNLILKWSSDNIKLKKTGTVSFNLPAIASCPQAGACAAVCYATQGSYTMWSVKVARQYNFDRAKSCRRQFEKDLFHDLLLIKQTSIRLHDSGDFFDQAYLNTWCWVIKHFPAKQFYCYTKSLHLDWTDLPDNFTMVQSVGGKLDHLIDLAKPHSRIFATEEGRLQAGYQDGNKDDSAAQQGLIKIGLVYHGRKNLTDNQKVRFA